MPSSSDAAIERVEAAAYRIPTGQPESDGTLAWDSTALVLVRDRLAGMFSRTPMQGSTPCDDPQARIAREQANRHGLTFAPDPATHSHNTLGGMIGNNSCGPHSVMGGETVHNVIELDILTYDGVRMAVGATGDEDFERLRRQGGRPAEIAAALKALAERHADAIRHRFPPIPYNLPRLLPENGFDLAKALVGTEGTCAIVLEARLRLLPNPPERVLLVLGYDSVYEAGDHVPEVMRSEPIALEGVDDRLVGDMKRMRMNPAGVGLLQGLQDRVPGQGRHGLVQGGVPVALPRAPPAAAGSLRLRLHRPLVPLGGPCAAACQCRHPDAGAGRHCQASDRHRAGARHPRLREPDLSAGFPPGACACAARRGAAVARHLQQPLPPRGAARGCAGAAACGLRRARAGPAALLRAPALRVRPAGCGAQLPAAHPANAGRRPARRHAHRGAGAGLPVGVQGGARDDAAAGRAGDAPARAELSSLRPVAAKNAGPSFHAARAQSGRARTLPSQDGAGHPKRAGAAAAARPGLVAGCPHALRLDEAVCDPLALHLTLLEEV